mgnify:CR=1 FL=1
MSSTLALMMKTCSRSACITLLLCMALIVGARMVGVALPPSTQLAFAVRGSEYAATFYVVDLARGLTARLIDGVYDRMISFAPDGQLVFSRFTEERHNIIFRMDSEGNEIQLSPDAVRDEYPVWSPDGAQVAFMSLEDNASRVTLYAMNSDGSQRRNLSQRMSPYTNVYAVWLPDNIRIMYSTLGVGQESTFLVNSQTGELVNFTYNTGIRALPAWSPDGRYIAYVLYSALRANIYVSEVDAEGSIIYGTTRELVNNDAFNTLPRWSPDGSRLVFETDYTGNSEIFAIDPDGRYIANLSQNPAADRFPVWSRDGAQIAFTSQRSGTPQIYIMNADGSNQRQVTYHDGNGQLSSATWLP